MIQWIESSQPREDLKLVLNRRMRTRMFGGAGGVPEPYPDRIVTRGFHLVLRVSHQA